MGIVYYGNYALYYEVGRVELMREIGMTYSELESKGILMPVTEFRIRYLRPARYDDQVIVETTVRELPSDRITFWYELRNNKNEVLNSGHVTLAFLDASTMKAVPAPEHLVELLRRYFP